MSNHSWKILSRSSSSVPSIFRATRRSSTEPASWQYRRNAAPDAVEGNQRQRNVDTKVDADQALAAPHHVARDEVEKLRMVEVHGDVRLTRLPALLLDELPGEVNPLVDPSLVTLIKLNCFGDFFGLDEAVSLRQRLPNV